MNRGLADSTEPTRLPSLRATSLSGGNCSLCFTNADCAPAVERPSCHAQSSMMRRKSATSSLLSTSGTQISIASSSEPRREHDGRDAARRFLNERRVALIQCRVVELVEDVVDEQLQLPVLVDPGLRKPIEGQVIRNGRHLFGSDRAAS